MTYDIFVTLLCAVSLVGNGIFFFKKKNDPKPELSLDAQKMLAQLASGPTVLKIEILDIENLLLRSPRG